jgi:hypothetical protein
LPKDRGAILGRVRREHDPEPPAAGASGGRCRAAFHEARLRLDEALPGDCQHGIAIERPLLYVELAQAARKGDDLVQQALRAFEGYEAERRTGMRA